MRQCDSLFVYWRVVPNLPYIMKPSEQVNLDTQKDDYKQGK